MFIPLQGLSDLVQIPSQSMFAFRMCDAGSKLERQQAASQV
jgi:hypothetical protein